MPDRVVPEDLRCLEILEILGRQRRRPEEYRECWREDGWLQCFRCFETSRRLVEWCRNLEKDRLSKCFRNTERPNS